MAGIASRARSSVGSFYRLVGDKDRLLAAVHDRFLAESRERIERELAAGAFEGQPAESIVRGFVALLVEVHVRRAGLLRALIVRSSDDPAFRARVHALNAQLEERLVALLRPHRRALLHEPGDEAIRFGARVALGALNHVTLVRSPEVRHPARLAQELARVLARYLGVPEAK